MRLLITVAAGMTLIAAPAMRAQNPQAAKNLANQAVAATGSKPASAGQATPAKPAPAQPQSAGKPAAAKSAAAKSGAAKPKSSTPAAKTVSEKRPAESEVKMARRDPFESLVGRQQAQDALARTFRRARRACRWAR